VSEIGRAVAKIKHRLCRKPNASDKTRRFIEYAVRRTQKRVAAHSRKSENEDYAYALDCGESHKNPKRRRAERVREYTGGGREFERKTERDHNSRRL